MGLFGACVGSEFTNEEYADMQLVCITFSVFNIFNTNIENALIKLVY